MQALNMHWSPEDEAFMRDVLGEVDSARIKFPSPNLCFAALVEEVGELAQALLKVRAGKWTYERIRAEAIQVAAMALRVATEDDPSFQNVEYREP